MTLLNYRFLLSTVSSGLNSLAAVTGEDILKAFKPDISEARYAFATKCFGELLIYPC